MVGLDEEITDLGKFSRTFLNKGSDLNPRNIRLGMYAWIIQRLTGLYLVVFVLTHIGAIAQANFGITTGPQAQILDVLRNPFWAIGQYGLLFDLVGLALIVFHGLNGIRIVFLDLGFGTRRHRLTFYATMIVAIAASAYVIVLGLPLIVRS